MSYYVTKWRRYPTKPSYTVPYSLAFSVRDRLSAKCFILDLLEGEVYVWLLMLVPHTGCDVLRDETVKSRAITGVATVMVKNVFKPHGSRYVN